MNLVEGNSVSQNKLKKTWVEVRCCAPNFSCLSNVVGLFLFVPSFPRVNIYIYGGFSADIHMIIPNLFDFGISKPNLLLWCYFAFPLQIVQVRLSKPL